MESSLGGADRPAHINDRQQTVPAASGYVPQQTRGKQANLPWAHSQGITPRGAART